MASEVGPKEDAQLLPGLWANRCWYLHSLLISLLSHQSILRISLSWIQVLFSLHFELSDFIVHIHTLFNEASLSYSFEKEKYMIPCVLEQLLENKAPHG